MCTLILLPTFLQKGLFERTDYLFYYQYYRNVAQGVAEL